MHYRLCDFYEELLLLTNHGLLENIFSNYGFFCTCLVFHMMLNFDEIVYDVKIEDAYMYLSWSI